MDDVLQQIVFMFTNGFANLFNPCNLDDCPEKGSENIRHDNISTLQTGLYAHPRKKFLVHHVLYDIELVGKRKRSVFSSRTLFLQ